MSPGPSPVDPVDIDALTHETLWRHVRRLVERAFVALEKDWAVDECLDIVVDLLGADRGMVLLREPDGTMRVVNARGHKRALAAEEREEMSRTIVRRAFEQDECVVWDPAAQTTSASFAMLRIVAALAAPLRGGRPHPSGVLYVDFRDPRRAVDERRVEFFMTAAALLGALLEQHERARTDRELLREVRGLYERALLRGGRGDGDPELLAEPVAPQRLLAVAPPAGAATPHGHPMVRGNEAPNAGATEAPSAGDAEALSARWQKVLADRATLEELEKDVLRQALSEAGGVVAYAARALGVARTTLASRLEALGIRAAKGPPR
jgi:transcriptional regulator with GAF, ATPase, and Fis domain